MLFNTAAFGVFLVLVVTLCWALGPASRLRPFVLLGASLFFYASWDARYLALVGAVILLDWSAARLIAHIDTAKLRRAALMICVGLNLGLLGFFKYVGFFAEAVSPLARWLGVSPPPVVTVVLPLGISFFTFHALSYVIDVYRGQAEVERSLWRFALFITFFPHLVAGPIVRAGQLLPQLKTPLPVTTQRFGRGLFLILGGLLKKVVLADYLAANLVDRVFDLPSHYSSLEALAAIYGYALQIYADFSGYSDIALGAALWLGVELPENFNLPYRADGLRDFWRRWHITLSVWLRDYLYIGLGGSRGGRLATARNLMVTMVLGGLWHGASYNFLIWGAMHGAVLVVGRLVGGGTRDERWAPRWLRVLATFHLVALLWVFFRADTFSGAIDLLAQVARLVPGRENLSWQLVGVIAAGYALHFAPSDIYQRATAWFVRAPATAQAAAVIAVLYAVGEVSARGAAPFIYFQF